MKTKQQLKKSLKHWEAELAVVASDIIEKQTQLSEIQLLIDALRIEIRNSSERRESRS